MPSITDEKLQEALQLTDHAASIFVRKGYKPEDVEDWSQNVLMSIGRQGGIPHKEGKKYEPFHYVMTGMRNQLRNQHAMEQRRVATTSWDAMPAPDNLVDFDRSGHGFDTEEDALAPEIDPFVHDALSDLHPSYAAVLIRHAAGYMNIETAAELGVANGTVMSGLSRAKSKMRAALSSQVDDPAFDPAIAARIHDAAA